MREQPVQVMLVDDHAVVRAGLKQLLESDGRFAVTGEAATAGEALRVAQATRPAIVIMDVRLPDQSGIEACREIRAAMPEARVIMLTSYPDDDAVVAAVMAGASGYLLKELDESALLRGLLIVAQGGSLLTPDLVARMLRQTQSRHADVLGQLSEQERQILTLIAQGRTNREIGEALFLSENTVKNYVSRLLEKLGLSRRSEAAAYVVRRQAHETGGAGVKAK